MTAKPRTREAGDNPAGNPPRAREGTATPLNRRNAEWAERRIADSPVHSRRSRNGREESEGTGLRENAPSRPIGKPRRAARRMHPLWAIVGLLTSSAGMAQEAQEARPIPAGVRPANPQELPNPAAVPVGPPVVEPPQVPVQHVLPTPQPTAEERKRDSELLQKWSETVEQAMQGASWDVLAANTAAALNEAGTTTNSALIADYLESLKLAADEEADLPEPAPEATPADLVQLLSTSRLLGPSQTDVQLLLRPLHFHRSRSGSAEQSIHWDLLGESPDHASTDPAIRLFKRGREAIPALLGALNDRTATRAGYTQPQATRASVLCRRSDLAMAILEAITRCDFYESRGAGGVWEWFSNLESADRSAAVDLARQWWAETQSLDEMDARSWLIERIPYDQASSMFEVLISEGQNDRAMRHLRSFLVRKDGTLEVAAANQLSRLGDPMPLNEVTARVQRGAEVTRDEITLLVQFGGAREFAVLQKMMHDDRPVDGKTRNAVSRLILSELASSMNHLAIPVLAEALDTQDEMIDLRLHGGVAAQQVQSMSRADAAALHIQRLTRRDFRYDPAAPADVRRKGIERIREWWESQGKGLYGFDGDRLRRTGGIR